MITKNKTTKMIINYKLIQVEDNMTNKVTVLLMNQMLILDKKINKLVWNLV